MALEAGRGVCAAGASNPAVRASAPFDRRPSLYRLLPLTLPLLLPLPCRGYLATSPDPIPFAVSAVAPPRHTRRWSPAAPLPTINRVFSATSLPHPPPPLPPVPVPDPFRGPNWAPLRPPGSPASGQGSQPVARLVSCQLLPEQIHVGDVLTKHFHLCSLSLRRLQLPTEDLPRKMPGDSAE